MKLSERYEQWKAAERRRRPELPGSHEGRARVALCYPNSYAVGMANLGYQAVWGLLAEHPRVHCDRLFLPETEDLARIRERREVLTTIEAGYPAAEAHLLAFAISFESDYLNLLSMLRLMELPLRRAARSASDPVVLVGGIGPTLNPHAVSEFADVLFLGEFEPAVERLAELSHALAMGELSKDGFLAQLRPEEGFYVPSRPETASALPVRATEFDRVAWSEFLSPHSQFPNMTLVELERGCPFSCRFCAAGYAYGNSRRHPLDRMVALVDESIECFGFDSSGGAPHQFGLIGGALTEYKWIRPLAEYIVRERGARFSLSSMRLKRLDPELLRLLAECGQRQVTVAPETGSERLRRVIKKNYTDEEVLESVRLSVGAGLWNVKLYSMIGLPTETDEDVDALRSLTDRCRTVMVEAAKQAGRRPGNIILSVGPFVPKPGTPFERAPLCNPAIIQQRYKFLEKAIRRIPNATVRFEGVNNSYLETFLSRLGPGDADLLERVHEKFWEGYGLNRVIKTFREELDARVFGWESKDSFVWQSAQDEKVRDWLGKEWTSANEGRISIARS